MSVSGGDYDRYYALYLDADRQLREAKEKIGELEMFLFAFVWNHATAPLGKSLGKSDGEIAAKTCETVAAAKEMVDIERMRGLMELGKSWTEGREREKE